MLDYLEGNRITLLRNGEQYFPALVEAIDGARSEVFLESYIFADDQTGSLVADALARAAARGVATHLLIDGFGAADFAPRFREMLARAGADVLVFRPGIWPKVFGRLRTPLRRMHRKLVSVDGRVAFVGGINIVDDSEGAKEGPPRYDYAVRIDGPLAQRVRGDASRLWWRVAWATLRRRWFAARRGAGVPPPPAPAAAGGHRAALVVRDNLRHRRDIEAAYIGHIEASRSEVLIANAYFFPTRRFRHALLAAARRGVAVTLLLQGKVEYMLQHYASRALYRALLAAGVRIFEYHRSFLHAKVAVFDGRVATIGSSNIDPFSLGLAQEANVFVDDAGFARELSSGLHQAIEREARAVPQNYWRRLSLAVRARIWLSYRLARLLMTVLGFDRLR